MALVKLVLRSLECEAITPHEFDEQSVFVEVQGLHLAQEFGDNI